jgi:hypothetical protein
MPVRAEPAEGNGEKPTPPPAPAEGNGTNAGIGGGADAQQTPQQEKMLASIGKLMDRGANLNQKVERDSSSTSVHINSQNLDH